MALNQDAQIKDHALLTPSRPFVIRDCLIQARGVLCTQRAYSSIALGQFRDIGGKALQLPRGYRLTGPIAPDAVNS